VYITDDLSCFELDGDPQVFVLPPPAELVDSDAHPNYSPCMVKEIKDRLERDSNSDIHSEAHWSDVGSVTKEDDSNSLDHTRAVWQNKQQEQQQQQQLKFQSNQPKPQLVVTSQLGKEQQRQSTTQSFVPQQIQLMTSRPGHEFLQSVTSRSNQHNSKTATISLSIQNVSPAASQTLTTHTGGSFVHTPASRTEHTSMIPSTITSHSSFVFPFPSTILATCSSQAGVTFSSPSISSSGGRFAAAIVNASQEPLGNTNGTTDVNSVHDYVSRTSNSHYKHVTPNRRNETGRDTSVMNIHEKLVSFSVSTNNTSSASSNSCDRKKHVHFVSEK